MSDSENPYILLTPGPLSTSRTVKEVMLRDWCTWDDDYNRIVQKIRSDLLWIAGNPEAYTSVLMQGSGTFSVESVLVSAIPENGKLLVLANGAYGKRIGTIAKRAKIKATLFDFGELATIDLSRVEKELQNDATISHVAVVHCETTTGMLNPLEELGALVKKFGKIFIVDAMSSFGGIPIDLTKIKADFLVSSANKCIQGVPGFGFVLAKRSEMIQLAGRSRSLSLDIYDQWQVMENQDGKWRFTSPTHVVRAFAKAIEELELEGGVMQRHKRYSNNHKLLVEGMSQLGFTPLLEVELRSPIITAFLNPQHEDYSFKRFYDALKAKGFVIYPGKVTDHDTFRIGTIGDIDATDMRQLIVAVKKSMYWKE